MVHFPPAASVAPGETPGVGIWTSGLSRGVNPFREQLLTRSREGAKVPSHFTLHTSHFTLPLDIVTFSVDLAGKIHLEVP